ncbi:MAG: hypothetical protein ACOYON_01440 [Fimbriimonas sp.]
MRFSFLSLAISAVLAPMAVGQDVNQKVTYTTTGGRASVVLPALGKLAGVRLEANGLPAEEVLTLRLKDVPLSEAMTRIATVTGSSWRTSGDGYTLVRESSLATSQAQDEAALRQKRIKAAIAKLVDDSSRWPEFDAKQAEKAASAIGAATSAPQQAFRLSGQPAQNPGALAIIQILALLNPAQLTLNEGQRVVFATQGTAMQKLLPGKAMAILRDFVKQNQIFAEAAKKHAPKDGTSVMIFGLSPEVGPGDPKLGIGKALLAVTAGRDGQLNLRLTVVDRNGDLLASSGMMVDGGSGADALPPSAGLAGDGVIPLSEIAKEFAILSAQSTGGGRMMVMGIATAVGPEAGGRPPRPGGEAAVEVSSLSSAGSPPKPVSDALRARLLKPEDFDPTSLAAGEALVTAAESLDKTLVAALPDSAVVPFMRVLVNGLKPGDLLRRLDQRLDVIAREESGTWLIQPELPVTSRRDRIPRKALGVLARSIVANSSLRLLDVGTYAAGQRKPIRMDELDGIILSNADPSVGSDDVSQLTFSNWNTLRIYGLMDGSQRQALGTGRPFPIGLMTGAQRDLIAEDYYGAGSGLQFMAGSGVQITQEIGGAPRRGPGPLASEPTEVLPLGIPQDGVLQVRFQDQQAVRAKDSISGAARILPVSSLALLNSMDTVDVPGVSFQKPNYDLFQPATQSRITFSFRLTRDVNYSRSLNDTSLVPNTKLGRWESLPADYVKAYEDALRRMRRGLL